MDDASASGTAAVSARDDDPDLVSVGPGRGRSAGRRLPRTAVHRHLELVEARSQLDHRLPPSGPGTPQLDRLPAGEVAAQCDPPRLWRVDAHRVAAGGEPHHGPPRAIW